MRRLFGAGALPVFSLWSWLITAPFYIGTMGGFDGADGPAEAARGLGVSITVHLLVGVIFLIANRIEHRIVRPWTHLGFVAVVILLTAVARPAMITELQRLTGGALPIPFDFGSRVLMNVLVIAIPLLVVHGLGSTLERSRRVRARLETVIARRDRQRADDRAAVATLIEALESTVISPVIDAIERSRVTPFEARAQAEALREVAHTVIRPLSHRVGAIEVATTTTPTPPLLTTPPIGEAGSAGTPGTPLRDARLRISAGPPWIPAGTFALLAVTSTVRVHGPATAALLLLLSIGVATGLGWLATLLRLQRLPLPVGGAILLLVELAIGVAAVGVLIVPAPPGLPWGYWISGATAFALIGWTNGLAASLLRRVHEDERALATIVAESDRRASAERANLRRIADRVGQVLHTDVQGRVIATTLRLRLGTAGADALDTLVDSVRADLRAALAPSSDPPDSSTARELLGRTLQTWSGAIDVRADIDQDVWEWLGQSGGRNELVLDAVSEALSNAVRHGDDGAVRLRLDRVDDGARLVVESRGRLRRGDGDGIGLRTLAERGAAIRLEQPQPSAVRLTVQIGRGGDEVQAPALAG